MLILFLLNLLFIVLCIPIVTIGPALSALMHTTLKLSEDENRTPLSRFGMNLNVILLKDASMDRVFSSNCCYGLYGSIYWNFANNNADLFRIIGLCYLCYQR